MKTSQIRQAIEKLKADRQVIDLAIQKLEEQERKQSAKKPRPVSVEKSA